MSKLLPEAVYWVDIGICLGTMALALATVWSHPMVYLSMIDDDIPTASLLLLLLLGLLVINHNLVDYYEGDVLDG